MVNYTDIVTRLKNIEYNFNGNTLEYEEKHNQHRILFDGDLIYHSDTAEELYNALELVLVMCNRLTN